MNKVIGTLTVLAVVLAALVVQAETDPIAGKRIDNIRKGTTTAKDRINKLYVAERTVNAAATANVTNSAVLDPANSIYILSGIGGAEDTTNTITIANAGADRLGMILTLIVDINSTNLISVADSGNVKASGAWVGDTNDVAVFYASATNVWIQIGEEDN